VRCCYKLAVINNRLSLFAANVLLPMQGPPSSNNQAAAAATAGVVPLCCPSS
jgi:hypothetical protein